jgi:isoleucyl-tRNA synthetase
MTALAEAELEYPEGHVSQSVYVAFAVASVDECEASEEQKALLVNSSLAVWTTTPWTMPANAAVAVNDQLDYAVVKVAKLADGSESQSNPDRTRPRLSERRWSSRRGSSPKPRGSGTSSSRRCAC